MKSRHKKDNQSSRKSVLPKGRSAGSVDQLGIERGQNAEKGNTVNPRNIRAREAKEAAH
jgi:hypothetical protein